MWGYASNSVSKGYNSYGDTCSTARKHFLLQYALALIDDGDGGRGEYPRARGDTGAGPVAAAELAGIYPNAAHGQGLARGHAFALSCLATQLPSAEPAG